jgi:predicted small secreted protein
LLDFVAVDELAYEEIAMRKVCGIVLLVAFVLTGCNTIAGLGRDMETLGSKIENKAEQKKNY